MPSQRRKPAAPPQEDRPFTVALSKAEVVALVKYHSSQAKRVTKAYGEASLNLQRRHSFASSRDLKTLADTAKNMLEAHTIRAKGLISILPRQ